MRVSEENFKKALEATGIKFHENVRSFVINQCPKCGGTKKVLIFREPAGQGRCLRCGWKFNAIGFIMEAAGMEFSRAKRLLKAGDADPINVGAGLKSELAESAEEKKEESLPIPSPMNMPINFWPIDSQFGLAGVEYLKKRGVSIELAKKYDLRYSAAAKRVVIPVYHGGACVGWQARDITGQAQIKIDSPAGFNKGRTYMGYDLLSKDVPHVIISEGPFDFLHLDPLGNSLCSMGAEITDVQIELIRRLSWVKDVYLGLDPDAFLKVHALAGKLEPEQRVWILTPPEDRQYWLDATADKNDFGNTTLDGVVHSFEHAVRFSRTAMLGTQLLRT